MKNFTTLKTCLATTALLAFAAQSYAAPMDGAAYKAEKTRISTEFKADKAACASMAGNAKDVCMEQAKAKEKVAQAELEYSNTGKPADEEKLMKVKAQTAYAVAKEKCDDLAGNPKDVCRKEAKAVETKALADVRMSKQIGQAKTDGAQEKRDADYKAGVEKCDALSGDAKAGCVASAKAKFGKS